MQFLKAFFREIAISSEVKAWNTFGVHNGIRDGSLSAVETSPSHLLLTLGLHREVASLLGDEMCQSVNQWVIDVLTACPVLSLKCRTKTPLQKALTLPKETRGSSFKIVIPY